MSRLETAMEELIGHMHRPTELTEFLLSTQNGQHLYTTHSKQELYTWIVQGEYHI